MKNNKEKLTRYILTKLQEGSLLARKNTHYKDQKLRYRSVYIKLRKHINDFLNGYVENRFITMPGLRGVGKSTLIFQIYDYLSNEKEISSDRILYISTDELNNFLDETLNDAINTFINEIHKKSPVTLDKELFIFIDESQNDEKWSQTGKILYDQSKKIFMIFTGSSALDLEINIDAVRRTKKETVFPMNFQEYILLKHEIYPPKGTSDAIKNMILTGNIKNASEKEIKLFNKLFKLKTPLKNEYETYLCCGGFPMSIYLNEFDIHEKTYNMIEKIIEKDVSYYQVIKNETKNTIFKIITFLALQNPGEISENKLSRSLQVSSSSIHAYLDILEKTHLIFNIKPYGGANKTIKKAWKYYFSSPSIKSCINFKLGKYAPEDRKFLGSLMENLVASYFFRMKKINNKPNGIFYPTEHGHADFLLTSFDGKTIPVEVGIGKKSKKQVNKSMNKYNSDYGIIISDTTQLIKKEDDIIYLPLVTFSFI